MMKGAVRALLLFVLCSAGFAQANVDTQSCTTIKFGMVDGADTQAKTAVAQVLLQNLGYTVRLKEKPTKKVFEDIAENKVDAFLGNWMPAHTELLEPYFKAKTITSLKQNLGGAKYTVAVPKYVYDAGVTSFADIAQHKDKFKGKFFGLNKGSSGNRRIQDMIDANKWGLKDFKIMPTSERLMLVQVKRHIADNQWILFLGWAPHPMNTQYEIEYLDGGDDYFGPNFGASTVHTIVRSDFEQDCPNASQLLTNLEFNLNMESEIMDMITNQFIPEDRAARSWMFENQTAVKTWLANVKQVDGTEVNVDALIANLELTFER